MSKTIPREFAEMLETCEFVYGRLSDLPLATRTPEERWDELLEWIVDEILPSLKKAIEKVKGNRISMSRKTDNNFETPPYRPKDAFFAGDFEDDIDAEEGYQDFDTGDTLSFEELDASRKKMCAFIEERLSVLSVFYQDIIKLRYGLVYDYPQSYKEIATFYNLTETAIRVAEREALLKLSNAKYFSETLEIARNLGEEVAKCGGDESVLESLKEEVVNLLDEFAS